MLEHLLAVDLDTVLTEVGEEAGVAASGGTPNATLTEIIGNAVSVVLGVLGVVFLGMTIYAGILWMTAGGNTEQIKKASGLLRNSVIGLIITLAAYAIAAFVVSEVQTAAGLGT